MRRWERIFGSIIFRDWNCDSDTNILIHTNDANFISIISIHSYIGIDTFMLVFILNLILMFSLGAVVFMVVRVLPRIEDNGQKRDERSFFERWLVSELPEKADLYLSSLLTKWLRKIRIFILRMDNILGNHLSKINPHAGKSRTNGGGFADIVEEKEE